MVEMESNGAYTFNASNIKLSLSQKTVLIEDVTLNGSLYTSPYYDVMILGFISLFNPESINIYGKIVGR
jgi:hypothetical protein